MPRRFIDWEKTGRALELLRGDNLNLRRYVCHELNCENGNCSGDCSTCTYDMDNRISRSELGSVFHVSENVVANWEHGITPVGLDDLLFYCEIAQVALEDIITYR